MRIIFYKIIYCIIIYYFSNSFVFADSINKVEFNWLAWQEILSDTVKLGTAFEIDSQLVNYKLLLKDQKIITITKNLKQYDPTKLTEIQKKAFYINAYNFFAVSMVLQNWPVDSIRDVGNIFFPVWDKEVGEINGDIITLSQIEHEILRPMGDPRIHFAIVCASMSCPDLSKSIYTSQNLEQLLETQTKSFLNNSTKGVKIHKNEILVSSIFKWFRSDFDEHGGILNFIKKYKAIPDTPSNINFLQYNWKLNTLNSVSHP